MDIINGVAAGFVIALTYGIWAWRDVRLAEVNLGRARLTFDREQLAEQVRSRADFIALQREAATSGPATTGPMVSSRGRLS